MQTLKSSRKKKRAELAARDTMHNSLNAVTVPKGCILSLQIKLFLKKKLNLKTKQNSVSLCSLDCPRAYCVDQSGQELIEILLPVSRVLGASL